MAGGKETPRQKMIGMMYLVLTALLALNVSKTVLEKFLVINTTLEETVAKSKVKNATTLAGIQTQVSESGNRGADVSVLKKAQLIRKKTTEVLTSLEGYKAGMLEMAGGLKEDGKTPLKIDDEVSVSNFMLRDKNGGKLKTELNAYVDFLSKNTKSSKFSKLALEPSEDPMYKDNPNQKSKNFSQVTFEHTPLSAALTVVSQFQTQVVANEAVALNELATAVGAADLKFDRIVAMVRPESKVVAAGAKYRAEMFIAASSSAVTPTMKMNGKDLKVEGGMGLVEFTASAGKYDKDGLAKKSFEAEISIPRPGGGDTTYTQKIEYFVAKPVIQIRSDAIQQLYLGCGNELQIDVPALGTAYNPSFSVTGGTKVVGQKGKVTIIPNAKVVSITVNSSGQRIGTEKFKVRPVPKPTTVITSRGRAINEKQGEKISSLRSLSIKAKAEAGFASQMPKDARYRVTKWTIQLARGPRPVGQAISATGQDVNIGNLMRNAKPGDRLSIEVKQVRRRNFKGNSLPATVNNKYITIPLN